MKQYHKLLEDILQYGEEVTDRTGVGTKSIFGYQMRFDLREGFPAVTTKKLAWKSVVGELLWFLEGSTDERRLAELTYGRDRTELVGKHTIWTANADKQGKDLGYVNNDYVKQLGPIYAYNWTRLEETSPEIVEIDKRYIDKKYDVFFKPEREEVRSVEDDDFLGKSLTSNYGRQFTVLDKRTVGKNSEYKIQFEDTHDVMWVTRPNLRRGQVGRRIVCGVGVNDCNGKMYKTDLGKRIYTLWYNMIRRCYDHSLLEYRYYGGNGVRVCKRWHRLSNFVADIERLPNYYSWVRSPSDYDLDKDYYGSDGYSPNTCVFIKTEHNISLSNGAIDFHVVKMCEFPDGRVKKFLFNKDIMSLYPDYDFTHEGVRMSILKGGKHRKCKFYKIECSKDKLFRKKLVKNQIKWLLDEIRTNSDSRRAIVSSWNPMQLDEMALPPCHTLFQFRVYNGRLNCQLYQRSADSFLGVPFNIASYALLTHIIARECNLEVGDFVHTIGDAHIYFNHIDQVKEQLSRKEYPLPALEISDDFKLKDGIYDEFGLATASMFILKNYQHHEAIKAPMAV